MSILLFFFLFSVLMNCCSLIQHNRSIFFIKRKRLAYDFLATSTRMKGTKVIERCLGLNRK